MWSALRGTCRVSHSISTLWLATGHPKITAFKNFYMRLVVSLAEERQELPGFRYGSNLSGPFHVDASNDFSGTRFTRK